MAFGTKFRNIYSLQRHQKAYARFHNLQTILIVETLLYFGQGRVEIGHYLFLAISQLEYPTKPVKMV